MGRTHTRARTHARTRMRALDSFCKRATRLDHILYRMQGAASVRKPEDPPFLMPAGACMLMDPPLGAVPASESAERHGAGKHVHPDEADELIPSDHYALRVEFRVVH